VGDVKGSEHRPQSRREALQAAYDRAVDPAQKGAKPAQAPRQPAADAKKGHNQPPEDTPDQKLNLKKRPTDQEAPPRGERGQFAPRQKAEAPAGTPVHAQDAQNTPGGDIRGNAGNYQKLPPHAPFAEPPARMAEHGKRDWAATPETVRGEVHRMHSEFSKAAQHYQGLAEAYRPIAPFDKMAREHGTTLEKALTNYVGIESKLRANTLAGLDTIIHNLGLRDPKTGQPIGLRDIAYHVLSQSPERLNQIQQGNAQQAAAHQIGSLYNEVRGLKQTLEQWQTAQQFTQTRGAVDQFAEKHPRFDELGDLIEKELRLGFPLEQAYQRAELLRPAAHADQTRNPSAQTRPDRSIFGNPDVTGSDPASRKPKKPSGSPREALANAMHRFNGRA